MFYPQRAAKRGPGVTRAAAVAMYRGGSRQCEIAEALGIGRSAVSYHLRRARDLGEIEAKTASGSAPPETEH